MKIKLRYLPKRSLLVAMITTALIFALYYAWNPPNAKVHRAKLVSVNDDSDNVLKSPLKSNPSNVDVVSVENASAGHNFVEPPPEVVPAEPVCQPLPLKVASIETSEIYPKLNFNVRYHSYFTFPSPVLSYCHTQSLRVPLQRDFDRFFLL